MNGIIKFSCISSCTKMYNDINFGLVCFQRLDEGANANLLVTQELNEAQSRGVSEGLEE